MNRASRAERWYWTPAIVFFIGICSVLLLLGVARLSERQRADFLAVDALDDLQIHIATFHIRLEEYLSGDSAAGLTPVWEQSDRAARIIDAIRFGGLDDHDEPIKGLRNAEYLATMNQASSVMSALRANAEQRLQRSRAGVIDPAVERRFHDKYQAIARDINNLEDRLEADSLRSFIKSRRLTRAVCAAWVLIVLVSTAGIFSSELRQKRSEEELRVAHDVVLAQSKELARHEQQLSELVRERTAELSRSNEQLHAEIAERRTAEDTLRATETQIRVLSSRLIQAQEFERKRIAMGLHDELGQALSVIKLQVRIVEKGLGEGQEGSRGECKKLLAYIDTVIADVRRLSLNLSPTVLEDLGLTAALQWLITGFAQNPSVQVTSEIAPIDTVFPVDIRIVVYRVIQEALTNIARHARAEHAAVIIRLHDAAVTFLVEDNGVGFDVERNAKNGPTEMGFGLTTMQERVRMIGGHFDLWSQKGKGTRISFTIPIENGGDGRGPL